MTGKVIQVNKVMSNQENSSEQWEARINALLDGELDEQEAAALKQEAESDPALARAIVEAYALQARLDELEVERAPASLRERLANIPKAESAGGKRWFGMPRWIPAGAMAAVPLALVAMVMMQSVEQQPDYSRAEVMQARQDVITAFAYLDRIGERAGREIHNELAEELNDGVTDNVAEHMPFTSRSRQEEKS